MQHLGYTYRLLAEIPAIILKQIFKMQKALRNREGNARTTLRLSPLTILQAKNVCVVSVHFRSVLRVFAFKFLVRNPLTRTRFIQ
jgi:hypothetical protein